MAGTRVININTVGSDYLGLEDGSGRRVEFLSVIIPFEVLRINEGA